MTPAVYLIRSDGALRILVEASAPFLLLVPKTVVLMPLCWTVLDHEQWEESGAETTGGRTGI